MKPLSHDEYEKLKVFIGCFYDVYLKRPQDPAEVHPLATCASIEKASLANAKRGLLMATNDFVEATSDWTPEQVAEADLRLAACNTYSLTEVRRRYSHKYLQILKRGKIRNSEEYYLIKGVADGGSIEPGATEGKQMEVLMADFEARVAQRM